jgi:hypothetical protein
MWDVGFCAIIYDATAPLTKSRRTLYIAALEHLQAARAFSLRMHVFLLWSRLAWAWAFS